jgi:hypothetical protein
MANADVRRRPLRAGDVVEVRSAAEILATLDANGELEALPFMPEMLAYLGRRLVVDRRAEKICDTVRYAGSRRLNDTVLLEDLRCDGSGHDGCQTGCRLFWKEAWLRLVGPEEALAPSSSGRDEAVGELARLVGTHTRRTVADEGGTAIRYCCQATELNRASEPLHVLDPRPYVNELTCGNVSLRTFVRVMARAVVEEPMSKLGLVPDIPLRGKGSTSPRTERLGLQPGEWVQVKSPAEIAETLNEKGRNRGLWFDREMLPFCGGTYRVRRRIERFVDDRDGKMIVLGSDCVTLEGVVCSGELSLLRWFCPRQIYPFWREGWLRRVVPAEQPKAEPEAARDAVSAGAGRT